MSKLPKQPSNFTIKFNTWLTDHLTRVRFVEKMLFVHHLQIMTRAGLSIISALKVLSEEIENKKLKKIIGQVKTEVEKGRQLSEVLADYPKIFPKVYVSMIAAGESSGKLEESLEQVSYQMKRSNELNSRIRGALIYPAVVLTAMVGISIEVVFFVLPKVMIMFEEFNAELPLPTKILIFIVKSAQNYGLWLLVGVIALIVFIRWFIKKPEVRKTLHKITLRLPIFGEVTKKINLARFTLTLSSLLQSGIPIIEAARITAEVQSNIMYREGLLMVAEELKKGEAISKILARLPRIFPPIVTEMIMVGEESGQVEQMLKELADYYGNEVDATLKNFSTIIEPVMILIMGLGVAGIAVAVIMPMYSLAQSF